MIMIYTQGSNFWSVNWCWWQFLLSVTVIRLQQEESYVINELWATFVRTRLYSTLLFLCEAINKLPLTLLKEKQYSHTHSSRGSGATINCWTCSNHSWKSLSGLCQCRNSESDERWVWGLQGGSSLSLFLVFLYFLVFSCCLTWAKFDWSDPNSAVLLCKTFHFSCANSIQMHFAGIQTVFSNVPLHFVHTASLTSPTAGSRKVKLKNSSLLLFACVLQQSLWNHQLWSEEAQMWPELLTSTLLRPFGTHRISISIRKMYVYIYTQTNLSYFLCLHWKLRFAVYVVTGLLGVKPGKWCEGRRYIHISTRHNTIFSSAQ